MESLQNIKRRLRGVKNIGQITKAMELVAATKMRRSQEIAIASRPYAFAALDLLATLSRALEATPGKTFSTIPLLEKRGVKRTAIVLITSDKGLAGSFNAAVIRDFEKFAAERGLDFSDPSYSFVAVGLKSAGYLEKRAPKLRERFVRFGDFTTMTQVRPLTDFLLRGFIEKEWDSVIVFSMNFRSALRQEVIRRQILPVDFVALKTAAQGLLPETGKFAELIREHRVSFFNAEKERIDDYLIEPSPEAVLTALIPHLVEIEVYDIILEANASEHAARRAAMKNASDNASDLGEGLTVQYNKSRQATITSQIIEIASGAEALR